MTQQRKAYIELNNLDLLDERYAPNPYASEECLFDECPDGLTLEEQFTNLDDQELSRQGEQTFTAGFSEYWKRSQENRPAIDPRGLLDSDPDALVVNTIPYAINQIRWRHFTRGEQDTVTALDRVQNASLYLLRAAKQYDHEQRPEAHARGLSDAAFIGMFKPFFDAYVLRSEEGGVGISEDNTLSEGDLIRIPYNKRGYYQLKKFHAQLEYSYGWKLEVDEVADMLRDITPETRTEYEELHVEHLPWHAFERDESFTDAYIDFDPQVDPHSAAATKVAHDGLATVLGHISEVQQNAIIARYGLDEGAEPLKLREVCQQLDIKNIETARARIRTGLDGLQAIPNVIDVLEGVAATLAAPVYEGTDRPGYKFAAKAATHNEQPLTLVQRALELVTDKDSIVDKLERAGVPKEELLKRAQIHPYLADKKLSGKVDISEQDAINLVVAATDLLLESFETNLIDTGAK